MDNLNLISNYDRACVESNEIDKLIVERLKEGENFRVEAGAGSGKTYSLNKVIEWIQSNKSDYYLAQKQKVVCITYTNAAVDVINERLSSDSKKFITASTIHTFAWESIKQYQKNIIEIIKNNEQYYPKDGDVNQIKKVEYTLGHRYIADDTLFLYHDDVIALFVTTLDNKKFRKIFSSKYPLILIDEYQDSFESIINKFIEHFISKKTGPQFGFFGDSWQTIYQSQKACGLIEHDNIIEIKKPSNFRSAPKIVNLLNKIRPELPQQSAVDLYEGEVVIINCNDYSGSRREDRNFKGDLPIDELKNRLDSVKSIIKENIIGKDETMKTLMITHKTLASQQGYEAILNVLGDSFKEKEDSILVFLLDKVEEVYASLLTTNSKKLFEVLKVSSYPILQKSMKKQWNELFKTLDEARKKKAIDVIKVIIESNLIPIPNEVNNIYLQYLKNPNESYNENATIKEYLDIRYCEFISAMNYFYPETDYSTDHGVKGEEYDNVIFTITKGWYNYQFEVYAPMILNGIQKGKESSYIRNRNLFYVCCSRAKRRLFIFVSLKVDSQFEQFLKYISENQYYTYSDFIEKYKNQNNY